MKLKQKHEIANVNESGAFKLKEDISTNTPFCDMIMIDYYRTERGIFYGRYV